VDWRKYHGVLHAIMFFLQKCILFILDLKFTNEKIELFSDTRIKTNACVSHSIVPPFLVGIKHTEKSMCERDRERRCFVWRKPVATNNKNFDCLWKVISKISLKQKLVYSYTITRSYLLQPLQLPSPWIVRDLRFYIVSQSFLSFSTLHLTPWAN
jgi:hypothetical protein